MKNIFVIFSLGMLTSFSLSAQTIPDSAVIELDETRVNPTPQQLLMDALYSAITRQEIAFRRQDTFFDMGKNKVANINDKEWEFAIGLRAGYQFETVLSARTKSIDYGANPAVVLYGTLFSKTIPIASFDVSAAGSARSKTSYSPMPGAKWWKPAFRADFLLLGKSIKQWKETDPEQVVENAANKIKTELGEIQKGASDLVPGMALAIPIVGPLQAYIDFGIISNFNFNMALALMPDMVNFKQSMASFMVGPSVRQSFFLEVGALLELGVGEASIAIAGIIDLFKAELAGIVSFKPAEMKIPIGLTGMMNFLSGSVVLKADITVGRPGKFGVQKGWSKSLFSWSGVSEQMSKMIGVIDLTSSSEFFTLCLNKDVNDYPMCATSEAAGLLARTNLSVPGAGTDGLLNTVSDTPTCGPGSPMQWVQYANTEVYEVVPCPPDPPLPPPCPDCAITHGPGYVNCPGPIPTAMKQDKKSSVVAMLNNAIGIPTCDATMMNCWGCCKDNSTSVFKVYAPWGVRVKAARTFQLVGAPAGWEVGTVMAADGIIDNLAITGMTTQPATLYQKSSPMLKITTSYGNCIGENCASTGPAWLHIYKNVSSDNCYKSTGSDPTIGADSSGSMTCKRPTNNDVINVIGDTAVIDSVKTGGGKTGSSTILGTQDSVLLESSQTLLNSGSVKTSGDSVKGSKVK